MSDTHSHDGVLPSEPDRLAIDALVDAGWDPDRVDPVLRTRAARIAQALGLLSNSKVRSDNILADIAFARAMRMNGHADASVPTLHPADQEAMDAWVIAGYDTSRVPASLRSRVFQHEKIGRLLIDSAPVGTNASSLVERTLLALEGAEAQRVGRLRVGSDIAPRRGRLRINDLVTVAAMLLIGAAVAIPVMSSTRAHMQQTICQANLGSTALAFSSYAADNRDALPIANAGFGGGSWWDVGKGRDRSNSANLFSLVAAGYVDLRDLSCPGNPEAPTETGQTSGFDWRRLEQVSYSYRLIPAGAAPRVHDDPRSVILADRSPVVLMAVRGQPVHPEANSPNHDDRGQHLLRGDGSATWAKSPVLAETADNIWLPRSIEDRIRAIRGRSTIEPIRGNELPSHALDVFLGP
ncbi:MAG: hypothetical protein KF902_08605 [Phycisphaeraceae bacterium]|nr:hypothetical protein [Phycisphaeraceae bacterium]MCW5767289.1 hypothetical protein [Phycisphaeraceae bacterium]